MKLEKPRTTPNDYIQFGGEQKRRLNFKENYDIPAFTAKTPWVPSRFTREDLINRVANQKTVRNKKLNFVPEEPGEDPYAMFTNLGRFDPEIDYDFSIGRPLTNSFPEQQPDFNPLWKEVYTYSPVIPPEEKTENPFPRQANLDPNGYLLAMAELGTDTSIPVLPDLISENPQGSVGVS